MGIKRIAITAGEHAVDRAPAVLETFLGSCVGLALYDKENQIGGLLHVILPEGMARKEREHPAAYVRSGVPFLLETLRAAGADCRNLVAALAGGAHIRDLTGGPGLGVGKRNVEAARSAMQEHGIPVVFEEVEGDVGRLMSFRLSDGQVKVRLSRSRLDPAVKAEHPVRTLPAEELAGTIAELRPVSKTAFEALELARDPSSSFPQIERLILRDQLLAANVLRLVNSAYYRLSVPVRTISQALAVLGLNAFRKLVMQVVAHHLCARPLAGYSMEEGVLFRHSLVTAQLAELLARGSGVAEEEAYLAGLLHDLGKVALERCAGPHFQQVVELACRQGMEFHRAEQTVLGTDHQTVGGLMAASWQLPPELTETISCHHRPLAATQARKNVSIVHVANALANALGVGLASDSMANFLDTAVLGELALDEGALDDLLVAVPRILSNDA